MKIKSFSQTSSSANYTYSYTKRGTKEPYFPDDKKEWHGNIDSYDKTSGNLFYDIEVSWRGEVLLDKSIDINIDLHDKTYVDYIYIRQGENSAPGSIDIYTLEDSNLKKISTCCDKSEILKNDLTIPVGYTCDNIVVRINGNYEPVSIKKFDMFIAEELENTVFPVPQSCTLNNGFFRFSGSTEISFDCEEAKSAAAYLCERLEEKTGISFKTTDSCSDISLSMCECEEEAFTINITETKCDISASSRKGFMYAADAVSQLVSSDGIKCVKIFDNPMMDFRGVHIALPFRSEISFFKKFIREIVVPLRYNAVIIQVSAAMRYDNYPEINEAWLKAIDKSQKGEWPTPPHYGFVGGDILEKSEVADLCDYIRSFGIEIIPEIQSLSHAQYITNAYPDLAERAEVSENKTFDGLYLADASPSSFYAHNMCPMHDKYYEYIFGIAEEVIEVMKPERFVHMGHDEGYDFATCPKCLSRNKAELYAEEVTKLNEYVKSKGLTMMMWSDMFQSEFYFTKLYSIPASINLVPKDIIMLDFTWYFHPELDLEERLLKNEFTVVYGNLYSSHFPRFEYRSKKKGIYGGQISMWVKCNEDVYAYEGKMYDMFYTANMMWNSEYDSRHRSVYNEIIMPLIWDAKCRIASINTKAPVKSIPFESSAKNIPNELLWNIPYDKAAVASQYEPEISFDIDAVAETIYITHATNLPCDRVMWRDATKIGEYEIVYEDDTTHTKSIYYGENIFKHKTKYATPLSSILFRHEGYSGTYSSKPICGKDDSGNDYTLLEMPIINPQPQKKIKKIVAKHMQNTDANICIYDIKIS